MIKTILQCVAMIAVVGMGYAIWPASSFGPDQWKFEPCGNTGTAICFRHARGINLEDGARTISAMGHQLVGRSLGDSCWYVLGEGWRKAGACTIKKES